MTKKVSSILTAGVLGFGTMAVAHDAGFTHSHDVSDLAQADAVEAVAEQAVEVAAEAATEVSAEAASTAKDAMAEVVAVAEEAAAAVEMTPDTVLVEVNGETFTAGDAEEMIQKRLSVYQGQIPPEQLQQLMPRIREQVQEEFLIRTLLKQETAKEAVEVADSEIDEMIAETKANLPAELTYDQFLEMQNLTEETIRDEVKMQLGIRQLLDKKLGDELEPTDEDIAAFYEEQKSQMVIPEGVQASHILIKFDEGDDDEAKATKKAEIDEIRKQLTEGADFAEVAREKSQCPSSASGGDLGQFGRGQMVPEFEEAAFSQPLDEVGDVVETQFGYHLIKVTEKSEGGVRSLDEVREDIKGMLTNQRRGEAFQGFIEELRAEADLSFPAQETAAP